MFEKYAMRSPCRDCAEHHRHIADLGKRVENSKHQGKDSEVCENCKLRIAYVNYIDLYPGARAYTEDVTHHLIAEPSKMPIIDRGWKASSHPKDIKQA